MTASKCYLRDVLGLGLIISSVMVMLGIIFSVLAVLNYLAGQDVAANTFLQEALPLFFFMVPSVLLARFISRPQWIHDIEDFQLAAAKKFSQTH
ncbi:D-fructose-6-phosphate amidotransferase [Photobacterium japonica]|uniref:D-fructose-6-phosphate amidotransferase n=1 Tax=Photobacterium japonica TaxID=2910235 RepID=UPI003D0EF2E2